MSSTLSGGPCSKSSCIRYFLRTDSLHSISNVVTRTWRTCGILRSTRETWARCGETRSGTLSPVILCFRSNTTNDIPCRSMWRTSSPMFNNSRTLSITGYGDIDYRPNFASALNQRRSGIVDAEQAGNDRRLFGKKPADFLLHRV